MVLNKTGCVKQKYKVASVMAVVELGTDACDKTVTSRNPKARFNFWQVRDAHRARQQMMWMKILVASLACGRQLSKKLQ